MYRDILPSDKKKIICSYVKPNFHFVENFVKQMKENNVDDIVKYWNRYCEILFNKGFLTQEETYISKYGVDIEKILNNWVINQEELENYLLIDNIDFTTLY